MPPVIAASSASKSGSSMSASDMVTFISLAPALEARRSASISLTSGGAWCGRTAAAAGGGGGRC